MKEFLPKRFYHHVFHSNDALSCCTTHGEEVAQREDDSSQALIHAPVEGLSHTCANNSVSCVANITFTDEDLLLGSTPHNRPLFVTGYTREQRVNRVLLDGGSAVNILLLRTMKELGISMDELEHSPFFNDSRVKPKGAKVYWYHKIRLVDRRHAFKRIIPSNRCQKILQHALGKTMAS